MKLKNRMQHRMRMKTTTRILLVTTSVSVFVILTFVIVFHLSDNHPSKANGKVEAIASGDWDNPAIWNTHVVPTFDDVVTVAGSNDAKGIIEVQIKGEARCAQLNVNSASQNVSVILKKGANLKVEGDLTINGGSVTGHRAVVKLEGEMHTTQTDLTIKGNLKILGTRKSHDAQLLASGESAGINLSGQLILPTEPTNYATLNCTDGAHFNYCGLSPQILKLKGNYKNDLIYSNVEINNPGGVLLEQSITPDVLTGDLTIHTGRLMTNGYEIAMSDNALFSIHDNAMFFTSTTTIGSGFPMKNVRCDIGFHSNVQFAAAWQNIPKLPDNQEYGIVTVSAYGTVYLAEDITIRNKLILSSGVLSLNGKTLNVISSAPDAISKINGNLTVDVSNGRSNINWYVKGSIGIYTVPFATLSGLPVPVTINIQDPGTGNGFLAFTTYETSFDNLPLPAGVGSLTNNEGLTATDFTDRFWVVQPKEFNTIPKGTMTLSLSKPEAGSVQDYHAMLWKNDTWQKSTTQQVKYKTAVVMQSVELSGIFALAGKGQIIPDTSVIIDPQPQTITTASSSDFN